jgi:hypothetical protein
MDDHETQRGGDKPRTPDEHDLTGAGTPRSADDGIAQPGGLSDTPDDAAVTTGMESTSQPAFSDDVTMNRSGSGGSGGPAVADESVEGSTGESMSELLAGEDDTEPSRG